MFQFSPFSYFLFIGYKGKLVFIKKKDWNQEGMWFVKFENEINKAMGCQAPIPYWIDIQPFKPSWRKGLDLISCR